MKNYMTFFIFFSSRLVNKVQVLLSLMVLGFLLVCSAPTRAENFVLSEHCPASFELRDGQCFFVSRYHFFSSVQNRGLGGTTTGLPAIREGFTPQQIDLGRYLFFDPILSSDNTVSCASCHQPDKGFSDGRKVSVGVQQKLGKRSAPTLWNVGFLDRLFWDGRATTLEQQALGPLFADNEMGNTQEQLLSSLNSVPAYHKLFQSAFPDQQQPINLNSIVTALTAFQSTLISLNSRYDQYALGYHQALSEQEIKGMNVFRSFVARCAECHQPPLFTNNQIAVIGVPEEAGLPLDPGAQTTFNAAKLRGGFKVPSLRNIVSTAPYMHAGNFATLKEATEFYNKGRGHAVPKEESLLIHWHIWEPHLSPQEITDIVAFLGALDDTSLMPAIPTELPSGLSATINQLQLSQTKTQTLGDQHEVE